MGFIFLMSAIVVVYTYMRRERIILPLEIEEKDGPGTFEGPRPGAWGCYGINRLHVRSRSSWNRYEYMYCISIVCQP